MENKETFTCKHCGGTFDELTKFPGALCLNCYKKTPDAKRPLTAADVVRAWGGKTPR